MGITSLIKVATRKRHIIFEETCITRSIYISNLSSVGLRERFRPPIHSLTSCANSITVSHRKTSPVLSQSFNSNSQSVSRDICLTVSQSRYSTSPAPYSAVYRQHSNTELQGNLPSALTHECVLSHSAPTIRSSCYRLSLLQQLAASHSIHLKCSQ